MFLLTVNVERRPTSSTEAACRETLSPGGENPYLGTDLIVKEQGNLSSVKNSLIRRTDPFNNKEGENILTMPWEKRVL